MKFTRRKLMQGIGGTGATLAFAGIASADEHDQQVQYIVIGGNGVSRRLERAGFDVVQELAGGQVFVAYGPAGADPASIRGVTHAAEGARFRLEEPGLEDGVTEASVELPAFYEEYLWDKQVTESLEANEYATGEAQQIAIVDTGIDYAHPELVPNLDEDAGRLFREGEIREGECEVVVPDDYGAPTELTTEEFHVADEQQGHGTHVAGIAAAADGDGVIGTAPDATLTSLRVFWWDLVPDEEAGELVPAAVTTSGDVLTAIDYAASEGHDVANLSLGTAPLPPQLNGETFVRAYKLVVEHAVQQGTVIAASAGNAETNLQQGGLFSLPNSIRGAMSVSATGPNDELSFYSNYGTNEIDVGAPGGGYETLEKTVVEDPEEVDWPFPTNLVFSATSLRVEGALYGWKAGTSMAAPQVAGLVALVRELEPEANARQVESAIKAGAEGATGRSDAALGAGRISALKTVEDLDGDGPGGSSR
ncbi:S8 family peptidase [Natronobeatus ordinarius]|uniref:S8 family peptidase n=1 Tax=Natronobeatus ordinarius TaxID=2963433 RepID=UPI0020CF3148|nr:S8 family serine peptidase [Natronobeatus ordinarius]